MPFYLQTINIYFKFVDHYANLLIFSFPIWKCHHYIFPNQGLTLIFLRIWINVYIATRRQWWTWWWWRNWCMRWGWRGREGPKNSLGSPWHAPCCCGSPSSPTYSAILADTVSSSSLALPICQCGPTLCICIHVELGSKGIGSQL